MARLSIRGSRRSSGRARPDGHEWEILDLVPDAALAIDARGIVVGANSRAREIFRRAAAELVGMETGALLHDAQGRPWHGRRSRDLAPGMRLSARRADATVLAVEATLSPVRAAGGRHLVLLLRDVSERARTEAMRAAETAVLEMIAGGAELGVVLDALARSMEASSPGMVASVLLADEEGRRLRNGASPSLPAAFVAAVDGSEIGPKGCPCAVAAWQRRLVVARDVATDPAWEGWRDLALQHGIRSCWSTPVLAGDGAVLGTFALYHREPRVPADADLELLDRATHVARIAIVREQGEQRRRETESRYRTLSELTSDFAYAFTFTDEGAKVDWVTDAFGRITGYDVGEWERRGAWRGIIHPEDLLAFEQRLPRLMRGEDVYGEVRIITKAGDVRWLSVYSRPVMDETGARVAGVVGAAQDFTARKEAEDAKTMFLATASHELKTPLTVIQGFAQLMGDERVSGHAERGGVEREAVDAIRRRAHQLNKIVDRILLSSRIETGRTSVVLTDVDIRPILAERVSSIAAVTARDVRLEHDALPPVIADADAVTTIVDHLLDNAIKYSPDGGAVRVSVSSGGEAVQVRVTDPGIGMTPDQSARCFEKFWQAESTDVRRFGGTGIGLFIVRSLVEAMGGQVHVESAPGAGSTFTFSLRRADLPPEGEQEPGVGERTSIQEFMRQIGVPERTEL